MVEVSVKGKSNYPLSFLRTLDMKIWSSVRPTREKKERTNPKDDRKNQSQISKKETDESEKEKQ